VRQKLAIFRRTVLFLTEEITGAQNFKFCRQICPQIEVFSLKFSTSEQKFSDKKIYRQFSDSHKFRIDSSNFLAFLLRRYCREH